MRRHSTRPLLTHRSAVSLSLVVVFVAGMAGASEAEREALVIGPDAPWRYLASDHAAPAGWQRWEYDDSAWPTGSAPFGTGTPTAATALPELAVGGTRLLLRRSFELADPAPVRSLSLRVCGAPFAASLNGVEILRSERTLGADRAETAGAAPCRSIELAGIAHELLAGRNLLALEVVAADGFWPLVSPRLELELGEAPGQPAATTAAAADRPWTAALPPSRLPATGGIRHVVLMVCDGWGPQQLEAANQLGGSVPAYQLGGDWLGLWMTTFAAGGSYDGGLAWSDFAYPLQGVTDSAAAATAMYTGSKTANGRISVDATAGDRLEAIGERARRLGMRVGAVTTVPVAHATPGAFSSHNDSRSHGYAISDEALFGDPNTTGTVATDPKYGGGFGPTLPPTDVLVGDRAAAFLNAAQRDLLAARSGSPGYHALVEGSAGVDGGAALLAVAAEPDCRMLAGLFDRVQLHATAPGGGYVLETPSLAQATTAALQVLGREPGGFVLMVEGGAVDWAGHANDMDWMIGELADFNRAVEAVVEWVEDPDNGSSWSDTLVMVTGDHETGYLSRAPGAFPDQLLAPGSVTVHTLDLEKIDLGSGRRASWLDSAPANDRIDPGETVFWAWNSSGHSNTLIPLYARGPGAELLPSLAVASDPVRGPYLDNTGVHLLMRTLLDSADAVFVDGFESGGTGAWSASTPPL